MADGISQAGGNVGIQFPTESSSLKRSNAIRGKTRGGREVSHSPDSSPNIPRSGALGTQDKAIKSRLVQARTAKPTLQQAAQTPQLPQTAKSSQSSQPAAALMTSDEVIKIAGKPRNDFGPIKQSPTYKAALASLDKYHGISGTVQKLHAFQDVQKSASEYLDKKTKESSPQELSSPEPSKRLAGARALGQSVKAEQMTLLTNAAKKLAADTFAPEARELAKTLASFPNHQLIETLKELPVEAASEFLNQILGIKRDENEDGCQTLDFVLSVKEQTDLPDKEIQRQIATTIAHGEPEVNAKTAKHAFDKGVMDINILTGIGQNNTIALNMESMQTKAGAEKEIAALDPNNFTSSRSWQVVQSGLKNDEGEVIISGGIKGSIDSDGTPMFAKHMTAQSNLVTMNAIYNASNGNSALDLMVTTWDMQEMKAKQEYNESIPLEKSGLRFDSNNKVLNKELEKLNSDFFKQVAEGKQFKPEDMGWKMLPDDWQTDPNSTPTKTEVVHDFLARKTPGVFG